MSKGATRAYVGKKSRAVMRGDHHSASIPLMSSPLPVFKTVCSLWHLGQIFAYWMVSYISPQSKQEAKAELGVIVPKIFLDNDTITVQIDLKELPYGRPGDNEAEWILEIPIDRERVSLGYRRENADLSTKRLLEAFKRKSSSHAGQ